MGIEQTARLLRRRLLEYRNEYIDQDVSIHIVAAEIAVSLVEFKLRVDRPISFVENQWFNAGYHLEMVVGNSKWSDILDLYYELVTQAKELGMVGD